MRRFLPITFLLIAIAVGFVLFSDTGAEPVSGDPEVAEVVEEGPQAGDYDPGTVVARSSDKVDAFDPRGLKVGAGQFGLHGTVVDERGQPVANAWVAAYSMPFPLMDFEFQIEEILDAPLELSLEPLASVQADDEGKFSLEGLFGRPTYLVARAHQRLTRGRQLIEAAELDSEKGVLLHTVAGASLDGTVRDENGALVANTEVFVLPSPMYLLQAFRNRDIYLERVYTDGGGKFSIDAVPAGAMLMALAFDGATHPGMHEFGPLTAGVKSEQQVSLAPTGTLSGKVVDEDGEPVSGAKLVAAPLDFRMILPFVRDMGAWITETGSDGSYEFRQLPERQYLVIAQGREGRSPLYSSRVTGKGSVAPEDIVVHSKQRIDGRVVDIKGRPIVGAKVALKSIPSKSGDGSGMRGGMPDAASIFRELLQEVAPEFLPVETYAISGGGGKFSIAAWKGARLEVEAADYPKAVFKAEFGDEESPVLVLMKPGSIEGKVVDSEGKPVKFFVVNGEHRRSALEPSVDIAHAEDEDWSVYRERRDAARKTATDALLEGVAGENEVILLPDMPALANLRNLRFHDDGTGRFDLQGLMPGAWEVQARAEGFVVGSSESTLVEEGGVTKDVEIVLSRGATIRGHVMAQGTREPIAGAVVTVGHGKESGFQAYLQMGMDTMAIARTDAEGAFELRGVDPGMEWVHALSEGFAPASLQIEEMQEGELREELILEVLLGGTIEGHVYDRHGSPLPGRMVGGMAPDSQDFWQSATDDEGYYIAKNVKAGTYFVVTAALDDDALFTGDFLSVLGGTRLAQAFVKDGETAEVDIVDLAAGGCKLTGQILSNGTPVRGAGLFAMATDTAGIFDFRMATARTNDNGEFDFGEMAPGEYSLQVQSPDWDGSIEFFVDEIPEDYQILEAPRGEVHGRVVHELTGQPIEGASVSLARDDGSGGGLFGMFGRGGGGGGGDWATTDSRGEYSFDGVSPGEYHIEVTMNRWGWSSDEPDSEPLGRAESRRFDVGENESRRVKDVQLPVASTISLVVTDGDGSTFGESFSIEAVRSDGEGDSISGWGWNGKGNVSGLEEGEWDVTVQAAGYATARQARVSIGIGDRVELQFQMQVGGDIHISMKDSTGQPLMGATISVLDSEGVRVSRKGLGAYAAFGGGEDGSFPAGTYAPGSYRVVVEWQGDRQEKRVNVVSDDFRLVEFTF